MIGLTWLKQKIKSLQHNVFSCINRQLNKIKELAIELRNFCMKKARKNMRLFWLYLTRPYPFKLWVAPRKKKWCFAEPEVEPKRKSPPVSSEEKDGSGKQTEYAMYLYPDSISTYWWIYFFSSVGFHSILDVLILDINIFLCQSIKYILGCILFALSYYIIYTHKRKPVLDELWPIWPDTTQHKEYFNNIYSSGSKKFKMEKVKDIVCNRPIFFNPRGSIQEGILRAAVADFFADKNENEFIWNIFIYFIPHVWVSFIYLLFNLMAAFRYHPYDNQNETIPLVALIVIWAIVSIIVLLKQYASIRFFSSYEEKMFKFSPRKVSFLAKLKMHTNYNFIKSLDPKKTISVIYTAAIAIYLVILNLVMQYGNPDETSKKNREKPATEQVVIKNECKHVHINIIDIKPCEEDCCCH